MKRVLALSVLLLGLISSSASFKLNVKPDQPIYNVLQNNAEIKFSVTAPEEDKGTKALSIATSFQNSFNLDHVRCFDADAAVIKTQVQVGDEMTTLTLSNLSRASKNYYCQGIAVSPYELLFFNDVNDEIPYRYSSTLTDEEEVNVVDHFTLLIVPFTDVVGGAQFLAKQECAKDNSLTIGFRAYPNVVLPAQTRFSILSPEYFTYFGESFDVAPTATCSLSFSSYTLGEERNSSSGLMAQTVPLVLSWEMSLDGDTTDAVLFTSPKPIDLKQGFSIQCMGIDSKSNSKLMKSSDVVQMEILTPYVSAKNLPLVSIRTKFPAPSCRPYSELFQTAPFAGLLSVETEVLPVPESSIETESTSDGDDGDDGDHDNDDDEADEEAKRTMVTAKMNIVSRFGATNVKTAFKKDDKLTFSIPLDISKATMSITCLTIDGVNVPPSDYLIYAPEDLGSSVSVTFLADAGVGNVENAVFSVQLGIKSSLAYIRKPDMAIITSFVPSKASERKKAQYTTISPVLPGIYSLPHANALVLKTSLFDSLNPFLAPYNSSDRSSILDIFTQEVAKQYNCHVFQQYRFFQDGNEVVFHVGCLGIHPQDYSQAGDKILQSLNHAKNSIYSKFGAVVQFHSLALVTEAETCFELDAPKLRFKNCLETRRPGKTSIPCQSIACGERQKCKFDANCVTDRCSAADKANGGGFRSASLLDHFEAISADSNEYGVCYESGHPPLTLIVFLSLTLVTVVLAGAILFIRSQSVKTDQDGLLVPLLE